MKPQQKSFIISIHDVTPAHAGAIRTIVDLLDDAGVPCSSLLLVPHYHGVALDSDPAFSDWIRKRVEAGDEMLLHGYRHIDEARHAGFVRSIRRALFTRGEGEFLGKPPAEARAMLREGKELLAGFGVSPAGFVAPAWLIEKELYPVLREEGFRYTTRQTCIVDLANDRSIATPTLVLRGSSLFMNRVTRGGCSVMASIVRNHPALRLAIHPADIHLGAEKWLRTIIEQLKRTRKHLTYSEYLDIL